MKAADLEVRTAQGFAFIGERALRMMQAGRNIHELCRETGLPYRDMRRAVLSAAMREKGR